MLFSTPYSAYNSHCIDLSSIDWAMIRSNESILSQAGSGKLNDLGPVRLLLVHVETNNLASESRPLDGGPHVTCQFFLKHVNVVSFSLIYPHVVCHIEEIIMIYVTIFQSPCRCHLNAHVAMSNLKKTDA